MKEFKHAVESRAIDSFWLSRTKYRLREKPEKIAQSLFAMFAKGVLGTHGNVLREVASGIGYVDVELNLSSSVLHIIEIKILTKGLAGPAQLEQYMKNEHRRFGYLIVIDTLPASTKRSLPEKLKTQNGTIYLLRIDVNPIAPSKLVFVS